MLGAWANLIRGAILDNEIHRSSLGGALAKSHKVKKKNLKITFVELMLLRG